MPRAKALQTKTSKKRTKTKTSKQASSSRTTAPTTTEKIHAYCWRVAAAT